MSELYIGLISGTSLDGVDAVIAEFQAGQFVGLLATYHYNYPAALRQRLLDLSLTQSPLSLREYCQLDTAVGRVFADAARAVLQASSIAADRIAAIGSHGQTLFHDGVAGLTLQFGDPNQIVANTGIATVSDFRRLDLALGGQGAPLVPAFHHALFAHPTEGRCILNLGGIANITVLPDSCANRVRGFDTGPANGLMDEWTQLHLGCPYDENGRLAAEGRPVATLVEALMSDPYFAQPAPKSTGRDYFRLEWVRERFPSLATLSPEDVQASLALLTARSVANAVRLEIPSAARILVCGGGARNAELLRLLGAELPATTIETTDRYGLAPEWIEASAFAWLAMRRIRGLGGNLPGVTGANQTAILGGMVLAPAGQS